MPGLVLSVSSSQLDYVTGEPIRLRVVLRNDSHDTIWVRDVREMPFDVEMIDSRGIREIGSVHSMSVPVTDLVPLPSGQSVLAFLHITLARFFDPPKGTGTYRLCIRYPDRPYGFAATTGERRVFSNLLLIRVEEPTRFQKTILTEFWRCVGGHARPREWIMQGAGCEDSLLAIIARHGTEAMTNYVRFALARDLMRAKSFEPRDSRIDEAIVLLEEIMALDPSFYREDVVLSYAECIRLLGRRPAARPLLDDLLTGDPLLATNDAFMWEYVLHRYYAIHYAGDPYWDWRKKQKQGQLDLNEYLPARE
jgi:hypothetical protein